MCDNLILGRVLNHSCFPNNVEEGLGAVKDVLLGRSVCIRKDKVVLCRFTRGEHNYTLKASSLKGLINLVPERGGVN